MIENHLFAHCKLGTITAITSILLASTPSSASEVTIIVEENFWYGSGNWFNASNWGPFGNLFDLPDPHLNTYIGPQSESHPAGPAIIKNGAFYSPSHTLYMAAWDGISQITIGANGSLTINGLIGYDNSQSHYQPTNPIQPSTVILDGGEISGNWTFYENSRVILRTANPSDNWNWSGTIGTLVIGPNVDFSLNTASNTTIKNLVNRGTLELDNSSGNLLNGTLTNQGTINLESGTSYIHNSTISNLPGIVKIDETAALYLSNSVLANGNVNGTGKLTGDSNSIYKGINYSGDLKISGGTLYNGQIDDTLTVTEGGYVSIAGKITNTGTLEMHGKNTTTRMQLASNALLTGNGETVLTGSNNFILGNNTEQSILTIDENHTLRGEGWLGQAGVGSLNIGNRGTIKAEGTLYANVGSIWNKYGTIEVTEDSNFSLQSGTVYNGSVTGTGTLSGNGKFQGVEFSGDLQISAGTIQSGKIYDTLTVTNAGYVSVAGTITNDGTLTMAGSNSTTRLMLAGNTILNGTGETVLGGSLNYIGSTTTKHTIAIGADQTLRGGGWIGSSSYGEVDVVNKGTVVADNGTLYTYGSTFNNAAGEIEINSGAALYVQKGTLDGGSISGAGTLTGSGTFQDVHYSGKLNISGGTIQGGHIDDTLTVTNGGYVSMAGTITNDGTFKLASTNSLTRLMLAGDTTLDGAGETVLGGIYNYIGSNSTSKTLTIGADQTLRGDGYIGSYSYGSVNVVNQGTVVADNGTLHAYGTTFDNTDGSVEVANGAIFSLDAGTLSGGKIVGTGTGAIGGGVFKDLNIDGTLSVANGNIASVSGTITNDGTFKLVSTNSLTRLMLAGDTTLDGAGETVLGGIYNYIGSNSTSKTLTIGADQTLRGGGYIGSYSYGSVNVVNQGTVVADNGTLYTYGSTFNNAAGEIEINSGAALSVQKGTLDGGSISGAGTLTGSGTFQDVHYSGGLNISGGTIQGGHIDDTLTVTNGGYVSMVGTITNDGTFKMTGTNSLTRLMLAGDTTLDGAGETVLGGIYNYIGSNSTSKTLTIGADQTLRGDGYIGSYSYGSVNVVNQGTVVADNGTLYTYGSTFNNAAGEIEINSGAALSVQKGTLDGGSISGAGTLTGSGTFQDVHYSGGLNISGGTIQGGHIDDTLTVTNGGYVSMVGTITNDGTFKIASTNSTTRLILAGDTTLDGTGETVLGRDYNYIGSSSAGKTLTIGADQTLRGGGRIGSSSYGEVDVVNKGTVVADNGTLYTYGSTFNNAAGEIQVKSGAALYVQKGTLNGGSISGAGTLTGSGTFQDVHYSGGLNISGGTIQGGHIDDTLTVTNGGYVSMVGTITNDGTFKMAGTNSTTHLMLAGDTILNGTGDTVLGGSINYIGSSSASNTLTIGADQTLRGGGRIGSSSYGEVDVVNKGTVVADNGTLYTYGSTFNNAAGEIEINSGAALYVQKGTLNGGSISGAGTLTGSGTYQDVHYSGGLKISGGTIQGGHIEDTLTVANSGYVSINGTVTNDGTLKLAGTSATTRLILTGDTTIDGTGDTVLGGSVNYIGSSSASNTLTIVSDQTLRGVGFIGSGSYGELKVVNQGTVASDSGTLRYYGSEFNNTDGMINIADTAVFSLDKGTLNGGVIKGAGTAAIAGSGLFKDLNIGGTLSVANGNIASVSGTITNDGTFKLVSTNSLTRLMLAGDTTLDGTGETVLGGIYNYIGSSSTGKTLTIGADQTLRGGGYIGSSSYGMVKVVNEGTIIAENNQTLYINSNGENVTNHGVIKIDTGSSLNSSTQAIVQSSATAITDVNGTLTTPQFILEAGILQGTGTINGNLLSLGGTISAGHSPGKLSVSGNMVLSDDSLIVIELAGNQKGISYDWLNVLGNVLLDGSLRLDFGDDIATGTTFNFLSSGPGLLSGVFDNIFSDDYLFDVTYGTSGVSVTVTGHHSLMMTSSMFMTSPSTPLIPASMSFEPTFYYFIPSSDFAVLPVSLDSTAIPEPNTTWLVIGGMGLLLAASSSRKLANGARVL